MTEEQAKNLKVGTKVRVSANYKSKWLANQIGEAVTNLDTNGEIAITFDLPNTLGTGKWLHYTDINFVGENVPTVLSAGLVCDCGGHATYGPDANEPAYHSRWCGIIKGVK